MGAVIYERVVRPALFRIGGGDAEAAHHATSEALARLARVPPAVAALRSWNGVSDPRTVFGVQFPGVVGLAAGMDKDGVALKAWPALGFGFVEVGTVTRRPQPGNPRPRLFRLRDSGAIVNRMGFNNAGADALAARLAALGPIGVPLGISIGKSKVTPVEEAVGDYLYSMRTLRRFASYVAINVSSPNTEGLRDLQESRTLRSLVEQVVARVGGRSVERQIPVLVKISPDATETDMLRSVDAAAEGGAAGVIATNTTVSRSSLHSRSHTAEAGGLSGLPLKASANSICRVLFRHLGHRIPIIGVGGIFTVDDAYERIRSGAALVQVYTGLIYEGPGMIHRLITGLAARLAKDGFSNIEEAIGIDAR